MSNSYQNEIPKARVNIRLDLHTGGAQKKMELPLKLLVTGDFSNGQEQRALSEREKVNVNKNNFDSVLAEFSPALNISVENTLAGDGSEENVRLPPSAVTSCCWSILPSATNLCLSTSTVWTGSRRLQEQSTSTLTSCSVRHGHLTCRSLMTRFVCTVCR